MYGPLKSEGLTDLEFLVVTSWDPETGPNWEDRADGYDSAEFPVMPDATAVYYIYGAYPYDVFLVDKKGRMVTKKSSFTSTMVDELKQKIRDLDAEL